MPEPLEQEIRTLQALLWSERDPEGLAFATLADAYLRAGRKKQALDLLEDGTARHPSFASGHIVAMRLYQGQGMLGEAELAARRVLELDSQNVVALVSLEAILREQDRVVEADRVAGALAELDAEAGTARTAQEAAAEVAQEAAAEVAQEAVAEVAQEAVAEVAQEVPGEEPDAEEYQTLAPMEGLEEITLVPEPGASGGLELEQGGELDASASPPDEEAAWRDAGFEIADADLLESLEGISLIPLDSAGQPSSIGTADADDDASLAEPEPDLAGVDALAPRALPEPEVVDMDALAPDEEPEPEVVEVDALAPDAEPEPEVVDVPALAPDEIPESEPDVIDVDALAPDEVLEPEVVDVDALEPDGEVEPEVVVVDALAPDAVLEPEVVDVDALAPDTEPEPEVVGVDALAPDEEAEPEVVDVDALAPDEGAEPEPEPEVVDVDALAPDAEPEPEEVVVDVDALAPDAVPEPDVIDVDALGPDEDAEPQIVDVDALVPDADAEAAPEAVDVDALGPDEDAEPQVVDVDALAPDEVPEPDVIDVDALAPDEAAEPEPQPKVVDVDALAPDEVPESEPDVVDVDASAADEEPEPAAPVVTRTLADLYLKQGFVDEALDVLRQLERMTPEAEDVRLRIAELERGAAAASETPVGGDSATESEEVVPEADASHDAGDDVEAAARELAEGGPGEHDVDTPFAWTEPEATPEASPRTDGPRIGEYFEGLLSWEPGEGS